MSSLASIGFLRMIFLRPFFPTIKRGKEIKFPMYVYVIIEILSLVLITKPVVKMLDNAISPFYIAHEDVFEPMLEIWALGMITVGVASAAISGIILCLLIRKMVRYFSRMINSV